VPEPEPVWVKSKWKAEELDKQRIEFLLRLKPGRDIAFGFGEIWARSRPLVDDRVSIEIVIEQPEGDWKVHPTVFRISQRWSEYIALHPDQSVARFQILMP
jgi:hypothetical protein